RRISIPSPSGRTTGKATQSGSGQRGRSATRIKSTISEPARTAPGLKAPITSTSGREGGIWSGVMIGRAGSRRTMTHPPPHPRARAGVLVWLLSIIFQDDAESGQGDGTERAQPGARFVRGERNRGGGRFGSS